MFSRLYFKSRYGSYMRSEHGIKKFAEMCMGQLIRRVTKRSAFFREQNENMLVEKANLRMRADELFEQPMLGAGKFFSVRRQLWVNNFIITAVVTAAIFLFFISITAFIDAGATVSDTLTWIVAGVLALVLAGGGLVVTERLIEVLIPRRSTAEEDGPGQAVAILWVILLFAIELAILGIVEVRADSLAMSQESDILYYGFILLSMMLPVVAGAVRWHTMGYYSAFKTTRAHRDIDSRLAQIDSILRQNEESESNFYKIKSIEYWDLLNEFKTLKDLYNQRHDLVESLGGHYAQSYDAFQREAYQRYEADIRDLSSTSMRRLESAERNSGSKLGKVPMPGSKIGQGGTAAAAPLDTATARAADRDAAKNVDGDLYLSPQPIR